MILYRQFQDMCYRFDKQNDIPNRSVYKCQSVYIYKGRPFKEIPMNPLWVSVESMTILPKGVSVWA